MVCVIFGCCTIPPARAQDIDRPAQVIDEEITAFAFAPDGRIVYAVRRPYKTKKYDLEHDDIWVQDAGGKRRKIFQGDKFTRGARPFTYTVDSFRWSPGGRIILAQLFITAIVDDTGKTEDAIATLVLEDTGKEVKLGGTDSFVNPAADATWLADNSTIVYATPAVKQAQPLYSFHYTNTATGPAGNCFEGRTFISAEPIPRSNSVIAVERDKAQSGPPRLQQLELLAQDDKELATLDGYAGGLAVSPAGHRVAYFIDNEVLEVRDISRPTFLARLRVGFGGIVHWSPDEMQILVKRAPEKKSGDIVVINVPELTVPASGRAIPIQEPTLNPVLHGLALRDFAISPDGRFLAVVPPGKRNLQLFPFGH
jgi:dipeptidyl aminopeptidase/acylaminoacyl peptidase